MTELQWDWLREGFQRPARRFTKASDGLQQPRKAHLTKILPNVTGLRSDEQLRQFLGSSRSNTVCINFGSSWCAHCHALLPHFLALTKQFPRIKYALAQVDYMDEGTRGITYTPTFAIYKRGRKVDQFFGANPQQIRDHLWLASQEVPAAAAAAAAAMGPTRDAAASVLPRR
ncbi:Thioredoxin-like 3-3 isoform B [Micractinium conductrix]|uniref:Thioredoxin-like 3-3 isoform B n=1 Tax=Micractinium conductrix TaxID=554055 RepID=A0A2P6V3D3_9CHLO|nr:Thioredoxin-like 3-3 isoform B [Micractinium conductrix]|eukprot:PSC68588.1 Thioredoxin-like 3-3 isoform B [Micractinium conductrix]